MKPKAFVELLESANEALEHSRGQRSLKTTSLPKPVEAGEADAPKLPDSRIVSRE